MSSQPCISLIFFILRRECLKGKKEKILKDHIFFQTLKSNKPASEETLGPMLCWLSADTDNLSVLVSITVVRTAPGWSGAGDARADDNWFSSRTAEVEAVASENYYSILSGFSNFLCKS